MTKGDDNTGAGEILNESLWSHGRDREPLQSQSWEKPKSASNLEAKNVHSVLSSESVPSVKQDIAMAPSSAVVAQSSIKVNETDKIWHYQDPSGKIQGPFSMVQLRKWSNTGYFPADLRIWRTNEKQDDSMLLTDALAGNFQREPQLVDSSFVKNQSPHHSSSYATHAGEGWKPQPESSNSTARAASAPLDVPKYSTEKWVSETNLPSPTPAQAATSGIMGKPYESRWSPTPAQPGGSLLGANSVPGGNGELQRATVVIPEITQLPHATPSPSAKPLSSINALQMHSQSTLPGESPRVQVISHPLLAPDSGGASVNTVIDMKSIQNLVQPVSNNNPIIGTQGWGAVSVSKPEMVASQAWGSAPSHKPEQNNTVSTQPNTYGNWGDASSAAHNSTSSFIAGNQTGVSPVPGTSGLAPSDLWRGQMPGQPNIQPSAAPSNVPWSMSTDNQSVTPRQGPENQNIGWGPVPGNPNMGWGGPVSANSNQGWAVSGQVPAPANTNPGWVAHGQVQAPGNANLGWAAPVQGQAPGNAFQGWMPPGQGQAPVNTNPAWIASGQGQPPGNANPNWAASSGNMGSWGSEKNNNGDRFSSQRDGGSQGGDTGYGGGKPWNRQSSFGSQRDGGSRPPFKGQRVCKFHENGHCKKGAACDYLHT